MELIIKKSIFLRGLYLAQGIADRKSTIRVLANVLLRVEGEVLSCAATDLHTSVVAELPVEKAVGGGLTVNAKYLHDIVKGLPGEEVSFRSLENQWAEIRAGRAEFKLVGTADRDFPKLPQHRDVSYARVPVKVLERLIAKTIFSVSQDETRPHLAGVLLEADGEKIRMVSTDGHRLSKVEERGGEGLRFEGVIVPRKGLLEMRRLLEVAGEECEVGLAHGHLFIRVSGVVVSVKLIEAQFPAYEEVIPRENEKVIRVSREVFLEAIRRVSLMSSDRTWGVRLSLGPGRLGVASDNPDLGEAREDLDVEYAGAPLMVGFNARFFMDVLSEMEQAEVVLELNGDLDPAVLHPPPSNSGSYVAVIMPMRI